MSTETTQPTDQPGNNTFVAIDGRDALAYVIIRPAEGGQVALEIAADGISKEQAAYILRYVADQWDPKPETQAAKEV